MYRSASNKQKNRPPPLTCALHLRAFWILVLHPDSAGLRIERDGRSDRDARLSSGSVCVAARQPRCSWLMMTGDSNSRSILDAFRRLDFSPPLTKTDHPDSASFGGKFDKAQS